MKLTNDQQITKDAFIDFLVNDDEKFMIIQGAAGTGKSTLIKELVITAEKRKDMSALLLRQKDSNFNLILSATTNPAAAVLEDLTGFNVKTIHSQMGIKIVNDYSTGKKKMRLKNYTMKIRDSLIIIDEASMINEELLNIIDTQTVNCKVVLIGDQYQLAPVNQSETVMETLACPSVQMNQIMRHSGAILYVSSLYRQAVETGEFPLYQTHGNAFKRVDGPTFKDLINQAYLSTGFSSKDTRILAWTNQRVQTYNNYVRELRGYPPEFQVGETVYTNKPIMGRGMRITPDSPVDITGIGSTYVQQDVEGNDVEINNRHVHFLPKNNDAERVVLKQLAAKKEWKAYFDIQDNWLDLRSPYACTVHKAQGSNYDTVFIDLPDIGSCREAATVARMLYVAISRAKYQVVCYGNLPQRYGG